MAKKEEKKDEKKPLAAKTVPVPATPAPALKGAKKGAAPVEAAPEVKEEKPKKEKISQKDRPRSKKKHAKVQIWKMYKVEGNKLVRKNENCPRCGAGTFLAHYKNRKYCGKCGWGQVTQ